jgi:hypothetical protein
MRLRDGDRFFYLNEEMLAHILVLDPDFEGMRFSDIIRRNSSITNIQDNVFLYPEGHHGVSTPEPTSFVSLFLLAIGGIYLKRRNKR